MRIGGYYSVQLNTDVNKTNIGTPVLIVSIIVSLVISFMSSSLSIALPAINKEFNASAVSLTWIVTAYALAIAVFSVPFSRIADIVGRKKILLWGTIIFTAISAITIFSNSVYMLIVCRSIQGMSSAMLQGTSIAMLTASFPKEKRGTVLGFSMACIFFGQSIGPSLGGYLTQHFGWRILFGFSIFSGLSLLIIILWKIKAEWIEAKGAKFDYLGSIIYGLALVAIIYGLSKVPQIQGIIISIVGLIGIFLFIKWESIVKSPVLDITLFRNNRVFVMANLSAVIISLTTFATTLLLSLYLQYVKGFTAGKAGLIFLVLPVTQAIITPFAGRLSDRVEPRIVSTAGMAFTLVGLIMLIFLNFGTAVIFICAILVILGLGMALFNSPNTNSIMSSVTSKHYNVAASFSNTMRTVGNTLSLSITMIVFALVIGQVSITAQNATQLLTCVKIIFSIFSGLSVVGLFTSMARRKLS